MVVTENNAQSLHLSDVTPRLLHHGVPVDIGEQAEAEPVALSHEKKMLRVLTNEIKEHYLAGVREPVHGDAGLAGVEGLAHPSVELVVADAAPEGGLAVHHRLGLQPGLGW